MKKTVKILFVLLCAGISFAQELTPLEVEFKNPPHAAKPLTWMHVMNGNISKEGLIKDIEAIEAAGVGGIILFNVTHRIPNGPVDFNSPEHIEMTAHAAAECKRLELSFGISNSNGWTSSGGSWVPVERSMKRVVYRETVINGGDVNMYLSKPTKRGGFYKDLAVLAYPALESEISDAENKALVTSSNPDLMSM